MGVVLLGRGGGLLIRASEFTCKRTRTLPNCFGSPEHAIPFDR